MFFRVQPRAQAFIFFGDVIQIPEFPDQIILIILGFNENFYSVNSIVELAKEYANLFNANVFGKENECRFNVEVSLNPKVQLSETKSNL